jgi:hypothetical protein
VKAWGLLKFGPVEFMRPFLKEGLIYCNTVDYFKKLEADELRADPCEGLSAVWDATQVEIDFRPLGGDEWIKWPRLTGQVTLEEDDDANLNVFCLYIHSRAWVDPRNFGFGDAVVFIRQPAELKRRIRDTLRKLDHPWERIQSNPVQYVNREFHSGKMGAFYKYDSFAYQQEFRYVFGPGYGEPFSFRIGSIEDIAFGGPSHKFNEFFRLNDRLLPPKRD